MRSANKLIWLGLVLLIIFANVLLFAKDFGGYLLILVGTLLVELVGRPLSIIFLFLMRWRIVGNTPRVPKYVVVIAPHRQGAGDVFRGLFARTIMRMPGWHSKTVMKIEIMSIPVIGQFLSLIGGIAADRDHSKGGLQKGELVRKLVAFLQKFFEFMVVFTPEGTRAHVEWKYGFYKTVLEAKVHLVLVCFDYLTGRIIIGDPMWLTGDEKTDFEMIKDWYAKHATNYIPKLEVSKKETVVN